LSLYYNIVDGNKKFQIFWDFGKLHDKKAHDVVKLFDGEKLMKIFFI